MTQPDVERGGDLFKLLRARFSPTFFHLERMHIFKCYGCTYSERAKVERAGKQGKVKGFPRRNGER